MSAATARRGRPRAFDRGEALRAAQALIWRHGYEAASLSQLEAAMGIGKTSLYAAFGSKLDLLREAADLYIAEAGARLAALLDGAPTALAGVRSFLDACARDFTDADRPYGCFLVSAALAASEENAAAAEFLRDGRAAVGALVARRLSRGLREGDLAPGAPTETMTEFIQTVVHGMTVQARDGRTEAQLLGAVGLAMAALAPFAAGEARRQASGAQPHP